MLKVVYALLMFCSLVAEPIYCLDFQDKFNFAVSYKHKTANGSIEYVSIEIDTSFVNIKRLRPLDVLLFNDEEILAEKIMFSESVNKVPITTSNRDYITEFLKVGNGTSANVLIQFKSKKFEYDFFRYAMERFDYKYRPYRKYEALITKSELKNNPAQYKEGYENFIAALEPFYLSITNKDSWKYAEVWDTVLVSQKEFDNFRYLNFIDSTTDWRKPPPVDSLSKFSVNCSYVVSDGHEWICIEIQQPNLKIIRVKSFTTLGFNSRSYQNLIKFDYLYNESEYEIVGNGKVAVNNLLNASMDVNDHGWKIFEFPNERFKITKICKQYIRNGMPFIMSRTDLEEEPSQEYYEKVLSFYKLLRAVSNYYPSKGNWVEKRLNRNDICKIEHYSVLDSTKFCDNMSVGFGPK